MSGEHHDSTCHPGGGVIGFDRGERGVLRRPARAPVRRGDARGHGQGEVRADLRGLWRSLPPPQIRAPSGGAAGSRSAAHTRHSARPVHWFDQSGGSSSRGAALGGAEPGPATRRGPGRRPATGRPPWTGPGRGLRRLEVMISARSRSCAPRHRARPGRRRGVVRRPGRWPAERTPRTAARPGRAAPRAAAQPAWWLTPPRAAPRVPHARPCRGVRRSTKCPALRVGDGVERARPGVRRAPPARRRTAHPAMSGSGARVGVPCRRGPGLDVWRCSRPPSARPRGRRAARPSATD